MPDFTVIEGGGRRPPGDFDMQMAARALRALAIELLRAIVRGHETEERVSIQLIELNKYLDKAEVDIYDVVRTVIGDLNSILTTAEMSIRRSDDPDREIEHIILASFQVAAEKLSLDPAAQGRTGQRMSRLENRLEARLRGLEERSREHGWSYVKNFLKQNFRQRLPPLPKPLTKKQLAADKAARRRFGDLIKEKTGQAADRQKPSARKKRWSPLDSRSYLDPKPED